MQPLIIIFGAIAINYNKSLYERKMVKYINNKNIEYSWKDIFNLFNVEKKFTPKEIKKAKDVYDIGKIAKDLKKLK